MTTSITDARFTHLHATQEYLLSLLMDEKPDSTWGHVMPGYDQDLEIPAHLEPPRLDADEVLPSQLHPSYPYGRPKALTKTGKKNQGAGARAVAANLLEEDGSGGTREQWRELNLSAVVERPDGREVPPVMAGSKRPPSPTSPALRPDAVPAPRSAHLRRHLERERQATPQAPADPFDAPVPNETYAEDEGHAEGMDVEQTPE